MKSKLKVSLAISLVGSFLLASVAFGTTSAGVNGAQNIVIGSNTNLTSLEAGTFQTPSGIDFGTLGTIDVKSSIPAKDAADYVGIYDSRGKNAGWSVKVSATPLTTTVRDETASSSTATVTVTIPTASVLQVKASDLKNYSSKTLPTLNPSSIAVDVSGALLVSADKAKGAGAYSLKANYTLTLPNYLPSGSTVLPTDPDSKLGGAVANVTDLGLFAGIYSTTITYASSTAP